VFYSFGEKFRPEITVQPLHVNKLKGAYSVEGWRVCIPKLFGRTSNRDYDNIDAAVAPEHRISDVIGTLFGFEADAGEKSLVLFGTGVKDFGRYVPPCGDREEHELFGAHASALFNSLQDLNADARGVGPLGRVLARNCPNVRRASVTLGVKPILRAHNLPTGGFKNLANELGGSDRGVLRKRRHANQQRVDEKK